MSLFGAQATICHKKHVRINMGNDAISCGGIRISFLKWISLKMSRPTKENIPLTHTQAHAHFFCFCLLFFPLELVCWACLILSGHLWCVSRPSKSQHCILACVSYWPYFFEDYRQVQSIEEGERKPRLQVFRTAGSKEAWVGHMGTILFSIEE